MTDAVTEAANSPDPSSGAHAYRKWQIRIFSATWVAYAGYYFCRKAFYVVKADLGTSLGLSTMDLANLGTAYLVSYMVGQFSSAFFGKILGPKKLLLTGMGASIVANLAFGFSNSYWTVMEFMVLNGLAQGTGWPGCIGSLAFWFRRKQRGTVLGFWSTCYQLGSVAATSFAAFMLGWQGWRWSFFGATMVLGVIWLAVFSLHPNRPKDVGLEPLDDPDSGESSQEQDLETFGQDASATGDTTQLPNTNSNTSGTERDGAGGSHFDRWLTGLGWNRRVLTTIVMMGLIYFSIKFLRYSLWSWVPYFFHRNYHTTGAEAGYLSTVFDISGFVGVLFAGFVSDRLFRGHRAGLSLIMLAMMTLGFAGLYLAGLAGVGYFVVGLGWVGFALYGPDSLLSGVGAIDVGSKKGALTAAGIINGMGSAGPIVQEEVIAFLYDRYDGSLLPVFGLLLAVAVLGTMVTAALWFRSRGGKTRL
ncbi:MAG: MFS transporter [Deltaproteobacteria bacterium]|nr:MFS transporter [Deltaproteobacteria bacterium]